MTQTTYTTYTTEARCLAAARRRGLVGVTRGSRGECGTVRAHDGGWYYHTCNWAIVLPGRMINHDPERAQVLKYLQNGGRRRPVTARPAKGEDDGTNNSVPIGR